MKGNVNSRRGLRPSSGRGGRHAAKSRLSRVLALFSAVAISGGLAVALAPAASAEPGNGQAQVWVCKYVGTPGAGESLQTGSGPILVAVSAVKNFVEIGEPFADSQGRSIVIDFQTPANTGQGNKYIGEKTCPVPDEGPGKASVTLTKVWAGGHSGDTVTLTASTGTDSSSSSAMSPAGLTSPISIEAEAGATVTLSETSLTDYTSALACTGATLVDNRFTVTNDMLGTTIICTFTNTYKAPDAEPTGSFSIAKTVDAPEGAFIGGEGFMFAGSYDCTVGEDSVKSGNFSVANHDSVTISGVPVGASCRAAETMPSKGLAAGYSWNAPSYSPDVEVDATAVRTITITNTATKDETQGNPGNPGNDNPGSNTPNTQTDTTPNITVLPQNNEVAKPPVKVLGVSQELPPAPVIKVKPAARVAPAPSANAHTGQGQSPWVYLLFGAGALLMLGAWRVRRNGNA